MIMKMNLWVERLCDIEITSKYGHLSDTDGIEWPDDTFYEKVMLYPIQNMQS